MLVAEVVLSLKQLLFAVHAPASVDEVAHLDASFGIASMSWPWRDIENDSPEANCIIVADSGLIAKAADPIDINSLRQGPPGGLAFPRGFCKTER